MAVLVISKRGRPLSRFIANPVGDGLLARARALSFALLGLMTAVGLGLVVFISNLGWPNILGGPIPGLPHSAVHSRVIVSRPTTSNHVPAPGSRRNPTVAPKPSGTGAGSGASGLSGSSKVVVPSSPPSHGSNQPSGNGASGGPPTSQPPAAPAPAPAPSPPPAVSAPPSTVASVAASPSESHGKGNGHGKGEGHAEGNGYSKVARPTASKSKAHNPAPQASAVTTQPPSPVAADPGKNESSPPPGEVSDGHGNGHGHAYGHYGK